MQAPLAVGEHASLLCASSRKSCRNWRVCVLRESGQVFCWGAGQMGCHGDGMEEFDREGPETPVAIDPSMAPIVSLHSNHSSYCALHEDGKLSCWGDNTLGAMADGTTDHAYVPVLAERWDVRLDYPMLPPPSM